MSTSTRPSSTRTLALFPVWRGAQPGRRLLIEVLEAPEARAPVLAQEVSLDVAEGIFDLALALAVAGGQGHGAELPVVPAHRLEERVHHHPVPEALQHHLLHPVVENLLRGTAGFLEGQYVAVTDGVRVGVQEEAEELPAAEAQHQREADDIRRLAGEQHLVRREADLPLHP